MEKETYDTLPPAIYDVNLAGIAKLKEQYMPLEITDLNNKEQFDAVHDARMVMVKVRTTIDKQRRSNNGTANKYIKDNNATAAELADAAAPIEMHLLAEEKKVTDEQKRIKAEEERKEKEKIQGRVDALFAVNVVLPYMEIAVMSDEEFEVWLSDAKHVWEIEQKRLAEEKKARDEEDARLALERAELVRIRKEQEDRARAQEEATKAIEAERKNLEEAKRAEEERKNREIFERDAKAKAQLEALKEANERIEREKEEKAKAAAEEDRQEALKPDKEKLLAWAKSLREIMIPPLADEDMQTIAAFALGNIYRIADDVINKTEVL